MKTYVSNVDFLPLRESLMGAESHSIHIIVDNKMQTVQFLGLDKNSAFLHFIMHCPYLKLKLLFLYEILIYQLLSPNMQAYL